MGAAQAFLSRNAKTLAVVLVVALIAVVGYFLVIKKDMKDGTAYFTSATNIYEGDPITVLGVKVGKINKISPGPDNVKVEFTYEAKYKIPADAKAAIISPSLIPARYIQLAPAYTGGPTLEDGGVIPIERTAVPVEFDELKAQLSEVTKTFGPEGANQDGSLNRILNLGKTFQGQGKEFNTFATELSKAVETLGKGSGDMFATVRNLQQFSGVLVQFDEAIREFGNRLDEVSGMLDQDRDLLRTAFENVDILTRDFDYFLADLASVVRPFTQEANEILTNFSRQRDTLAQILHVGPTVLTNFSNIISTQTGGVTGKVSLATLGSAGGAYDPICGSIISAVANDVQKGQDLCVQYLGPIFSLLNKLPFPLGAPIGTNIIQTPGGGQANGPDPLATLDERGQGESAPDPNPPARSVIPPNLPSQGLQDLFGLGGN